MLVAAHVGHFYPGLPTVSPTWGTADGWMPWRLLLGLYGELRRVLALERLNATQAAAAGASAMWAKEGEYKRLVTKTLEEAYPR